MKIIMDGASDIVVFLNHYQMKKFDFQNREQLEEYLKEIFLKLKHDHQISIAGYYQIGVYLDPYYGTILNIEKEELEYFDYYDNQIDMRITIYHDCIFLYELFDYLQLSPTILKKGRLYRFQDQLYFKLNEVLTEIELGNLLEHSILHYGDQAEEIMQLSKTVTLP